MVGPRKEQQDQNVSESGSCSQPARSKLHFRKDLCQRKNDAQRGELDFGVEARGLLQGPLPVRLPDKLFDARLLLADKQVAIKLCARVPPAMGNISPLKNSFGISAWRSKRRYSASLTWEMFCARFINAKLTLAPAKARGSHAKIATSTIPVCRDS